MTHRIALFLSCLAFAGAVSAQEVVINSTIRVGGNVEVTQPATGPLHLAAGRVRVNAPVEGSVRAAGGKVDIGPDAVISESASIAGGHITVDGAVKEELHVAGGKIRINGTVGGNVSVAGGMLEIGPAARIAGKLTFRGEDLVQDPAAQVTGGVEHIRGASHRPHRELSTSERFMRGWIWSVSLMVLAALVAAALPGPSHRMALELRERPWLTLLLGILTLAAVPVAAVMLVITIIGIPIALLALIAYAALLLVGYVWLAVVVGGLLLDRAKPQTAALAAWRAAAAVLAMLVLALLVRVPVLGGLVTFMALVTGVGMIVAAIFRHKGPAETQPA